VKCIFCKNELKGNTKPEHILLAALGGRKATRRVVCSEHNEAFGGTSDKELGEQVAVLRNLLQLDSGTGAPPPMLRNMKSGNEKVNFRGDGIPELVSKPFRVTKREDGAQDIEIVVNSATKIANIIPHLAAHLRCSEEELKRTLASGEASFISKRPDTIRHRFSLGGPQALRSITKSCLVLWALRVGNEKVKSHLYNDARRFVLEGGDEFYNKGIHLDTRSLPCADELVRRFGHFFNLIYVSSDPQGRVVAHFTLYNTISWHIVLATGGSPSARIGIASNPLNPATWSDTIADEIPIAFAWLDAPDYSDEFERSRERITNAYQHHVKTSFARELRSIISDVFRKYGIVEEGDVMINPEIGEKIASEVARRVTLLALKLPYEEKLTPEEIATYLDGKR